MGKIRDVQRSKIYKAENEVQLGRRLETVQEMQAFCDAITRSRWWRNRWPHISHIEVRDGRGRRSATGYQAGGLIKRNGVIKMPSWSRNELTVLHEISHVVSISWGEPDHGRLFARNYLALVTRFLSKQHGTQLRRAYRKYRVKWNKKRS